ncbi:uncharacterized protein LOC131928320, partial [Physella acuta]|uniref:uncharacterized protein LOC131928320 n=1 Tax=Physella acuta TaxID=109671 RepID=UPI0027DD3D02
MDSVDGVDLSSSADDVIKEASLVFTARPDTPTCEIQRITGHRLRVQQLCAVLRKRWILLRRAPLSVLLLMLASVSLLTIYISSSHKSPFVQSMYFKAQDYNDIIVVMGKPREPEAQQIYNSVRELLPPDFQVIEPDSKSTYYDYLKDWGRANSVERYRDNLMMGFEIKQPPESSIVYYQSSFVHSEAVA